MEDKRQEKCYLCGAPVPEGKQVCPNCEANYPRDDGIVYLNRKAKPMKNAPFLRRFIRKKRHKSETEK